MLDDERQMEITKFIDYDIRGQTKLNEFPSTGQLDLKVFGLLW